MVSIRRLSLCIALLAGLTASPAGAQGPAQVSEAAKKPVEQSKPLPEVHAPILIPILRPDLVVSLSSDSKATAGTNLAVTVKVTNKGTLKAIGTSEGPADKAYMVDLVWSADSNIPTKPAVQPVYQGLSKDDFVEDMLVLGGRISNTTSIPPGGSVTYSLPAYVPKKILPGTYWLGAYVDSYNRVAESNEANNTTSTKVLIGTATTVTTTVPAGTDYWVMPWKVGDTALYDIKPTGLTDYTDGLSGRLMTDAPFGGHLGFRHGYDSRLPTDALRYYRWLYQPVGGSTWQEFSETIGAHYEHRVGAVVSFPVYVLGPKPIGSMNLYEFRPHDPPTAEPGAVNAWPATDWFGDIYSGLLSSTALPEGTYRFRLEVYDKDGNLVTPGPAAFQFLAPSGTAADGTVTTVPAPAASIDSDGKGFVFKLHVDNRSTSAVIDAPLLGGGSATDACGFLLYDPAVSPAAAAAKIGLAFHATHPAKFAVFSFDVIRAVTNVIDVAGEVSAPTAGAFAGDGSGNFSASLARTDLLGTCSLPAGKGKGAFAEVLYVYPKATTGWRQRISAYDAYTVRSFALAPK
jgi:hypothetical protein